MRREFLETVMKILDTFQYRKRYEVTCDLVALIVAPSWCFGFNTASGMRSHATNAVITAQSTVKAVSIPQAV